MRRIFAASLMSLMLSTAAFAAEGDEAKTDAAKTEAKTEVKSDKKSDKKAEKKSETKTEKTEAKSDAKPAEKKVAKSSGGGGGSVGGAFSAVGSFVAGTFVGIPVSMFRKSKQETITATKDLVGDTDNKFLLGAAGILGVPAGILSGTIQGMVYGPLNAYRGTKDEPFSAEAFSLGDSK
jgi:hypothetical protein